MTREYLDINKHPEGFGIKYSDKRNNPTFLNKKRINKNISLTLLMIVISQSGQKEISYHNPTF